MSPTRIFPSASPKQLIVEVESSKKRLEDDLGKCVSMFAYPRGRHNRKVIASLKQAGYAGARTTAMLARELKLTLSECRPPYMSFPIPGLNIFATLPGSGISGALGTCHLSSRAKNWVELAKSLFDTVLRTADYGTSMDIPGKLKSFGFGAA